MSIRLGEYRAGDYEFLSVDDEIKELWKDIFCYSAKDIELDLPLKCFLPDYIPSTGNCDFMLKVTPIPSKEIMRCVANKA
jgi:hypothetical protein